MLAVVGLDPGSAGQLQHQGPGTAAQVAAGFKNLGLVAEPGQLHGGGHAGPAATNNRNIHRDR